ncbi:MAG: hypothetical protein M0Z41_08570 [Peptococcaceae bacterium]|jgi:hypothetical protein|nr:hypothetical protein [Peptococcaceae bacterium]
MFVQQAVYHLTARIAGILVQKGGEERITERRIEIDPWVAGGIGLFITLMLGGAYWAAVNGWFGPWIAGLLTKISGQFS